MEYKFDVDKLIHLATGVGTDMGSAADNASLTSGFLGTKVGVINNMTEGLLADLMEVANMDFAGYDLKDALNAYQYELLGNQEGRRLVITHSAGNKDLKKALEILKMENRQVLGLDIASVGSPVGAGSLRSRLDAIGGSLWSQDNNFWDPVTRPYLWGGAAIVAAGAGAVGATVGGTVFGLQSLFHGYDEYQNKNKDFQNNLKNWMQKHASFSSEARGGAIVGSKTSTTPKKPKQEGLKVKNSPKNQGSGQGSGNKQKIDIPGEQPRNYIQPNPAPAVSAPAFDLAPQIWEDFLDTSRLKNHLGLQKSKPKTNTAGANSGNTGSEIKSQLKIEPMHRAPMQIAPMQKSQIQIELLKIELNYLGKYK